ncbi:MAG: hypothetical protein NTX59_06740 [Elusimicrobia bacterium]|nr:hypothetical protein [Elusimicrobiota bacterium]
MRIFKHIRKAGLMAVLASLLSNTGVKAADIYFDGSSSGLSFSEAVLNIKEQTKSLNGYKLQPSVATVYAGTTPSTALISGARTYDFRTLYKDLGYPDPAYFGASPEEVQDLETYTSKEDTFYKEVNDYLRYYPEPYTWYGTSPEAAKAMVNNIDHVFTRVPPLPGDIILFRGIGLGFRANKSYEIGEEFIEKGYASTSTSFKVAHYFAVEKDDGDGNSRKAILAIYNNRPGEKGILIDAQEDEVILKHGTKFRVMAKKDTGEKYDFYLVQACSAPCETALSEGVRNFFGNFNVR